jgi:hypothetical protein
MRSGALKFGKNMGHFKVNQKDIFFILKEQLQYGVLLTLDRYKRLTEKQ